MDRDAEIAAEYAEMQKRYSQTFKVEPPPNTKWYLFEKYGRESWVSSYKKEQIGHIQDYWIKLRGWKVTEVSVFRTGIDV